MEKTKKAQAIIAAVQTLSTIADTAEALEAEYFDANGFTDADMPHSDMKASDLADCVTLIQQVNKLMKGEATSQAIYRATLNKVRRL